MSDSKEKLQSAVSDIALIRQTMERAGAHLDKLSSLLILYGIGIPIIIVISWLFMLATVKAGDYETGAQVSVLFDCVEFMFIVRLLFFFLKKRREIKESGGGYPLRLFDLWGVILLIVPMTVKVINFLLYGFVPGFDPGMSSSLLTQIVSHTMNCTMLTVALMFTGLMLDRKWLIWTGAGLLVAYPLLFMFGGGEPRDIVIVSGFYSERGMLVSLIIPLICLGAGIYFRRIGFRTGEESA